mgnify:CR=1 FL=1
MNLKDSRKRIFISLWCILEACMLYYCFMSLGVGIVIVTLFLIFVSCLLLLFRSCRIRAVLYLLLSIYSIFSVLGVCILYLFSTRVEQNIWYYIPILFILSINIWISFGGFWNNWKKSLPLT